MRPISFSGMEDAITVQKPNGTHVSYHIFEESEIHLNRITHSCHNVLAGIVEKERPVHTHSPIVSEQ